MRSDTMSTSRPAGVDRRPTGSGGPRTTAGPSSPFVGRRNALVSVCIPTRDRARYLEEALSSVMREELDDLEVIVCDDASTDDTPAVVAALDDGRISYHRHESRVGIARNRNACLELARGRYLAWLDDDDRYLPGGLRRQIGLLEAEPSVALVHGAIEVTDRDGRARPAWPGPFSEDTVEEGPAAFRELILSNYVRAPSAVTRASAHRRAGPYATGLGDRAEDWDAWLRLALEGDVAYRARPVGVYRCHGSATTARTSSIAWLKAETRVVHRALAFSDRIFGGDELRIRALAALTARHFEAAGDALARGRERTAYRASRRASRLLPEMGPVIREAASHAHRADEHRFHRAAREVLEHVASVLAGSRFGAALEARLDASESWSGERVAVARRIRQVVPMGSRVAAIDKWDPSLLHEAGRRGWHFPDLALSPDGYPADDGQAIEHLEAQRARGVEYLVVPRASFWWLEHYLRFSSHLDRRHERVWADDVCVIYRLGSPVQRASA